MPTNEPIYDALEKECKENNKRGHKKMCGLLTEVMQDSCSFCNREPRSPLQSQDKGIDAMLEGRYFRVLETKEHGGAEYAENIAVFKFQFCPMCGRNICREEA